MDRFIGKCEADCVATFAVKTTHMYLKFLCDNPMIKSLYG